MARRSSYQIRSPPKEVFPESTLSPGGLQLTTLFWDTGILFHQGSHAGARVGNNFEVFGCITTHVSAKCNAPTKVGSTVGMDDIILSLGTIHLIPNYLLTRRLGHQTSISRKDRASSEGAVHHASETGLGPVQNGTAPGSPIDRQAGYGRGTGYSNNVSMGNSALQGHNRNPQFQNATGHDRTGVGGVRNGNIDINTRHERGRFVETSRTLTRVKLRVIHSVIDLRAHGHTNGVGDRSRSVLHGPTPTSEYHFKLAGAVRLARDVM
ncbi:hypothetical protein BJY52DRAFT_1220508 [Lactarius psammicola]|nr:hypothetical protein BJY52DRAFT_1220508 [Lactarius psammicola]